MRNQRIHPIILINASEVLVGWWGDGDVRVRALTQAGFNYNDVQAEVNRQVAKANEEYVRRKVWRNVN